VKKRQNEEIKNNKRSNKNDDYDDREFNLMNEEIYKMKDMGKNKKIKDDDFKNMKNDKNKIVDKKKYANNYEFNPDRQKNIDRELDLGFLPKELLYNDKSYNDSKNNLLAAIEILEKAQDNKNQVEKKGRKAR